MGISGKYGQVETERGDIPDDEPVFVIRARDVFALAVLRTYGSACEAGGAGPVHVAGARAAAREFYAWQQANPGLVKVPDTPPGAQQ